MSGSNQIFSDDHHNYNQQYETITLVFGTALNSVVFKLRLDGNVVIWQLILSVVGTGTGLGGLAFANSTTLLPKKYRPSATVNASQSMGVAFVNSVGKIPMTVTVESSGVVTFDPAIFSTAPGVTVFPANTTPARCAGVYGIL